MYEKWKKGIFTVAGAIIMGAALQLFLVPLHITAGGVSGIAMVLNHLSGIGVGFLILLINLPLFILGLVHFSKRFLLYSLLGTVVLSLSTQVFSGIPAMTGEPLLAALIGGASMGLGLGLVLSVNGTTGGTDIMVLLLKKRFPAFSVGQFFLLVDGLVISLAGFVFQQWEVILYSGITLFVTSKVIDAILTGVDYAQMVYIISEHAAEISQGIYKDMRRGVTGLESVSFYTGKSRQVLFCVIRKVELPKLKQVVHEIDGDAFVIVSDAREVLGKGFKVE